MQCPQTSTIWGVTVSAAPQKSNKISICCFFFMLIILFWNSCHIFIFSNNIFFHDFVLTPSRVQSMKTVSESCFDSRQMTDIVWGWGGAKVIRVEIRLILVIFVSLAVGGYCVWVEEGCGGLHKGNRCNAHPGNYLGKAYIFYALWTPWLTLHQACNDTKYLLWVRLPHSWQTSCNDALCVN